MCLFFSSTYFVVVVVEALGYTQYCKELEGGEKRKRWDEQGEGRGEREREREREEGGGKCRGVRLREKKVYGVDWTGRK